MLKQGLSDANESYWKFFHKEMGLSVWSITLKEDHKTNKQKANILYPQYV